MKRIKKMTVKAAIRKQGQITVGLLPCKANPMSVWMSPYWMTFYNVTDFEKTVNSFTCYNCNNELGKYPAYYIKDGVNNA